MIPNKNPHSPNFDYDAGGSTTGWENPNMQQCPRCYQLGLPIVWSGTIPPSCQYCGYVVGHPVVPHHDPWFNQRHKCNCHCHCHCNCRCHRDWEPVQVNVSWAAHTNEPKKEKKEQS